MFKFDWFPVEIFLQSFSHFSYLSLFLLVRKTGLFSHKKEMKKIILAL